MGYGDNGARYLGNGNVWTCLGVTLKDWGDIGFKACDLQCACEHIGRLIRTHSGWQDGCWRYGFHVFIKHWLEPVVQSLSGRVEAALDGFDG